MDWNLVDKIQVVKDRKVNLSARVLRPLPGQLLQSNPCLATAFQVFHQVVHPWWSGELISHPAVAFEYGVDPRMHATHRRNGLDQTEKSHYRKKSGMRVALHEGCLRADTHPEQASANLLVHSESNPP